MTIKELCKETNLCESTYYYNCKHDTSEKYDPSLMNKIEILHDLRNTWGYRQSTKQLLEYFDIKVNPNTVRRYRKANNIIAQRYFKRKSKVYPDHDPKFECENIAKDLKVDKKNVLWNVDITYHILKSGVKSYKFAIKDAYSKVIVNYKYSLNFDLSLVLDTLEEAINLCDVSELTIHTDHGSHFIAKDFTKLLQTYNIKHSMSELGSPHQNQMIESYFGLYKNTLVSRKEQYTFEEMKLKIESWVFNYNYINIISERKTRSIWGNDPLSILAMN